MFFKKKRKMSEEKIEQEELKDTTNSTETEEGTEETTETQEEVIVEKTDEEKTKTVMYVSLQIGRAVAAILIVLFHLGGAMSSDRYFNIKEFYALFPGGPLKKSTLIAGIPKPKSCI